MTNNQPQFTIAELGAKFGSQIAQVFSELITLEKVIESQQVQIQAVTKNEARLQGRIQELEAQVAEFTKQEYDFVDHIQTLESELDVMKTADTEQIPLGSSRTTPAHTSLENENFKLKAEITVLEDRTQEIEAELAEYRVLTKLTSMAPEPARDSG